MGSSDGEWEPSHGRAASKIAQSFSLAMEDAFKIEYDPITELSLSVARRQESISSHKFELEQLEARIREAESKLRDRRSRLSTPAGSLNSHPTNDSSPYQRPELHGVFTPPSSIDERQSPQNQDSSVAARHNGGWSLLPSPTQENHLPRTPASHTTTSYSYRSNARDSGLGSSYTPPVTGDVESRRIPSMGVRGFVRRKKSGALDL